MRKKALSLLLATLLPGYSFALGLGNIEVNSILNERLDAQINLLSGVPQDAEALIIKLASREEFKKAGMDHPLLLNELKFGTLVEDENIYITVKTKAPVREPSLSFLLDIDWPKGHMIREYTILLMPPVVSDQTAR